ncbi:SEC-C domain-containing protein [Pigmentiphaga aceris]|uniref:SEC-C domain-containing protein n=1 Tax=Pigmentiphaga aceris TaxID=1940612 RepID=A0A5C0AR83_9BURK|nr:SEC-C domain-containing protein [Pigmentiphaga aceris]QEI04405.1 SEC-C domain-containing protein [Pigmentiphaga aceris]
MPNRRGDAYIPWRYFNGVLAFAAVENLVALNIIYINWIPKMGRQKLSATDKVAATASAIISTTPLTCNEFIKSEIMTARTTKIGRNQLCPCGSKKKYKRCHGGINATPTLKPGQIDAQIKKSAKKPKFLAPEGLLHQCSGNPIASHTVSRSGSLGEIAKNGHVYSNAFSIKRLDEMGGRLVPKLTGWKDASTFPGFCSLHDKQLFAALEDEAFSGSQQQCFLLSYRSIVWELYAKQRSDQNSQLRAALTKSQNKQLREFIGQFNYINELGFRDIRSHKKSYDETLTNERWNDCHGLLVEFDQIFPIQCSAAWSPIEDINGITLQEMDDTPRLPQSTALVSFAADGKSYFLLAWLEYSAQVSAKLANSISNLPQSDVPSVIAALLLLTSENCHFSPEWYDALTDIGKDWVHNLAHPAGFKPTATAAAAHGSHHIGKVGVTRMLNF